MPELPEVETTLNGIKPFILHQKITQVTVRHHGLRWPIPADLRAVLIGQTVHNIERRGKYLLVRMAAGTLIIHLGMSGRLRILAVDALAQKHDHVDIVFGEQHCLRFTDPRRFGAFLWTVAEVSAHPLLAELGPEPLTAALTGKYLWQRAQGRKVPVKSFIMDSKVVVGVGNIYANEALFAAGIHPKKAAGKISLASYEKLVIAIQKILRAAIKQGGTTLKDFVNSDGKKGYFRIHLAVYGRGGEKCLECGSLLKEIRLGQRSTVFCGKCQKM